MRYKTCDECRSLLRKMADIASYDDDRLRMEHLELTAGLQRKACCPHPDKECKILTLIREMIEELRKLSL